MTTNKLAGCLISCQLLSGDLERIREHYFALTPEDRLNRFGGVIGDEALEKYIASINFDGKLVLGLERLDTGHLVGLAELWFDNPQCPDVAEIAVSVENGWRRKGVGVQLVADAAQVAFARGATQVELHFAPDNRAIKRIVRNLGGERCAVDGKAVLAAPMPIAA